MTSVQFVSVQKVFGNTIALKDFSLHVTSGELICLLGPSGCGKTTALRILAGFEKPDHGEVTVDGERIDGIAVEKRNFGMVFQDYSLFPNMTAQANIEFGLRMHKEPSARRKSICERMLEVTQLTSHAGKYPHQLSGGQKQRVALARALATEPRVLLLDEPLSALDALVRDALRDEIRRIQQELGITTIFVTHDQHEALAIADRVAVMSEGRLEQIAAPQDLYLIPSNAFVANFIGSMNRIPATALTSHSVSTLGRTVSTLGETASRGEVWVGIRPEQLEIAQSGHAVAGIIEEVTFLGTVTRLTVHLDLGFNVMVDALSIPGHRYHQSEPVRVKLRDEVDAVSVIGDVA